MGGNAPESMLRQADEFLLLAASAHLLPLPAHARECVFDARAAKVRHLCICGGMSCICVCVSFVGHSLKCDTHRCVLSLTLFPSNTKQHTRSLY